jgi:hypothetical protein
MLTFFSLIFCDIIRTDVDHRNDAAPLEFFTEPRAEDARS